MDLNVCVCDEFLSCHQNWQKIKFWTFQTNLRELGLFHPYFVCKCCFKKISMIKIVILNQSKSISLILKIENRKFKNPKFVNCTFIINKNGNKRSIQPILKSDSASFIINNIFL